MLIYKCLPEVPSLNMTSRFTWVNQWIRIHAGLVFKHWIYISMLISHDDNKLMWTMCVIYNGMHDTMTRVCIQVCLIHWGVLTSIEIYGRLRFEYMYVNCPHTYISIRTWSFSQSLPHYTGSILYLHFIVSIRVLNIPFILPVAESTSAPSVSTCVTAQVLPSSFIPEAATLHQQQASVQAIMGVYMHHADELFYLRECTCNEVVTNCVSAFSTTIYSVLVQVLSGHAITI